MNKPEWLIQIERQHTKCGPAGCETFQLLSALNKAYEALEETRDGINKLIEASVRGSMNGMAAELMHVSDIASAGLSFNPTKEDK